MMAEDWLVVAGLLCGLTGTAAAVWMLVKELGR